LKSTFDRARGDSSNVGVEENAAAQGLGAGVIGEQVFR
jgi:hypothetical protein